MSILITGGAGYIGSHTAKRLSGVGREIVVLDNLSTGRRRNACWGSLVEGEIGDAALVRKVLRDHHVTAVVHLAASTDVAESAMRPDFYFENNILATKRLLDAMHDEGVRQLVFASSCSVYGNTISETVNEEHAASPLSPYGESKLAVERMLPWYERAWGLRWMALRYFNAAGAEDALGEDIAVSHRIIPRAMHAALTTGATLRMYGTSFATNDGSAVRDYVHVSDIAQANLCALKWVEALHTGGIINIGAGHGTSVHDIVRAVETETGRRVPCEVHPAREGDPEHVVADLSAARKVLGWTPHCSDIQTIVRSLLRSCETRRAGPE